MVTASGDSGSQHDCGFDPLKLDDLAELPQHVAWREDAIGGKAKKIPCDPKTGRPAKSNDPSTWGTRKEAQTCATQLLRLGAKGGTGIQLGPIVGREELCLGGVDLDTCRNNLTGMIAPWAKEVIDRFASYAEVSPSSEGAKIFFLYSSTDLPALREALGDQSGRSFKRGKGKHPPAIECFVGKRYFTITGERLVDTPIELRRVPLGDILWVIQEVGPQFTGAKRATRKRHDGSGSGALFSLAGQIKRTGGAKGDFEAAVAGNPEAARHVEQQEDPQRAIDRAWDRSPGPDDDVTEWSVAEAFRELHGSELLYNHDTGQWHVWDGRHWRPDRTQLAFNFAGEACADAAAESKSARSRAMLRASSARGVETFAQANRTFAVTSDKFDQNPFLLGTPTATVDLRTGKPRPACQEDFITKLTAVGPIPLDKFDLEKHCPNFRAFLGDATGGDADLIRALQQWFGYTLTGDVREEQLVFIHGPGGSGKSTLVNAIGDLLRDYCINIPAETLTESRYERHPTELARLHGARMAWASETRQGRAWNQKRINELTGGDTITARFMRRDFFSFKPQFKLIIVGNNQPGLRNVDAAARRRFIVVPFRHQPKRVDDTLKAKLQKEWPGILSWLILGCLDWQKNGLRWPKVVTDYTTEYLSHQDVAQKWLDECCDVHSACADTTERLWHSWSRFSSGEGADPGNKTQTFPDALREHGFTPAEKIGPKRARGWRGLRIKPEQAGESLS